MRLKVLRLNGEKRLVVDTRQIVMTQLSMTESTEIEGSQIAVVNMEHVAILLNGIFPLLQINVSFSLTQSEIDILRVPTDRLHEG